MEHAIEIRPYRSADLERIMEIERAAFPKAPYPRKMFRELYRDCGELFLIAKCGRRIAGYMVTCVRGGTAEVVSIAVDPPFRRARVGSALMRYTLRELRRARATRVDLAVRVTSGAISFYRRFGFAEVRRLKKYYEDGT